MTRREFSAGLGAGALALALRGPLCGADEKPSKRPNIFLMIADNLGVESVGTYGGSLFATPRIDSIGREGVIFERCYIGTPLWAPARAGHMTGRYPECGGVRSQPSPGNPDEGLSPDEVTIAEVLRSAGYRTAIFGKWNPGYDWAFLPNHQRFDTYCGISAGHADYSTHEYDRDGKKHLYRHTALIGPEGHMDNLCTDEAVRYLEARASNDRPFFAVMAFSAPHGPYQAPPGYPSGGTTDEVYGFMIDNLDRNTGRILDALRKTGAEENTLIVFISDQGSSRMNPYRRDVTEGGLRVVCHARQSGRTRPGTRVHTRIISSDWFATFAELGGGEVPADRLIAGRNIARLLNGDGPCARKTFL